MRKTTLIALGMALLAAAAPAAADETKPLEEVSETHLLEQVDGGVETYPRCQVFFYTLSPPGYVFRPECLIPHGILG